MIAVVARVGKGYVAELKFRDKFKHPNGDLSHSYDVIFRIPHHEIVNSKQLINKLMAKIEIALEKEAEINYNGFGRHKRDWMDENFLTD